MTICDMRQVLFTVGACLSLLLFLAVAALWVRSVWFVDVLGYTPWVGGTGQVKSLFSCPGFIEYFEHNPNKPWQPSSFNMQTFPRTGQFDDPGWALGGSKGAILGFYYKRHTYKPGNTALELAIPNWFMMILFGVGPAGPTPNKIIMNQFGMASSRAVLPGL